LPGVGETLAKVGVLLLEAGDASAKPAEFVVGHGAARRVIVTRSGAGYQSALRRQNHGEHSVTGGGDGPGFSLARLQTDRLVNTRLNGGDP